MNPTDPLRQPHQKLPGREVRAIVTEVLVAVGLDALAPCGDHSCSFGPPGGMGTNGGCRCFEKWRQLSGGEAQALARAVRSLAEQLLLERVHAVARQLAAMSGSAHTSDGVASVVEAIAEWLRRRMDAEARHHHDVPGVLAGLIHELRSGAWRAH